MADKASCSESGRDTRKRTNPGGRHPKINQRTACISLSDKHKAHKQQKAPFFLLCLQSSWLHVNIFVEAVMWVQTHTSMLVGQRVWGRQIGRVKDHSWREPAVPLVCLEIRPWTHLKKKNTLTSVYHFYSCLSLFVLVYLVLPSVWGTEEGKSNFYILFNSSTRCLFDIRLCHMHLKASYRVQCIFGKSRY